MLSDLETERRALALFRRALDTERMDAAALEAELTDADATVRVRVRAMLESHRSSTSTVERRWHASIEPVLPSMLGPYALTRELGRGGMGVVLLGERDVAGIKQRVAIKLVQPGRVDPERRLRFTLERELVARLRHPHIAQLLDGGEGPEGELWYAMELVEGSALTVHCEERHLGIRARVALLIDLCEAVGHAHRHSILHRDIKPSNVLVTADGVLKLIDFGIAKALGGDQSDLTLEAQPVTPRYAAPELSRGERASTASDIWQLGALAFELLVGQPLRDGDESATSTPSRRAQAAGAATSDAFGLEPAQLALTLRGDLDAIVMKSIRPEPDARYASASELAADLRAWLASAPVAARNSERGYALRRMLGAHRWAVAFAALALVAVIGGGVASLVMAQRAREEAHIAKSTSELLSKMLLSTHNAPNLTSMRLRDFFAHVVETALADKQLPPLQRYDLLYDLIPRAKEAGAAEASERAARALLEAAPAAAGARSLHVAVAHDFVAAAAIHTRGREAVDEAARHLRSAKALYDELDLHGNPEYLMTHLRAQIRLHQLRGEYGDMLREARAAVVVAQKHKLGLRLNFHPLLVTALAANGEWKAAAAEADWAVAQAEAAAVSAPGIGNMLDWLRSRSCEMRARHDAALAKTVCDPLLARLERDNRLATRIGKDALLGRAIASSAEGRHDAALSALETAGRSLDAIEGVQSQSVDRFELDRARGRALFESGRLADAETVQRSVLETQVLRLGVDHPESLQLRIELLETLRAAGKSVSEALPQGATSDVRRLTPEWRNRWDALLASSLGVAQ